MEGITMPAEKIDVERLAREAQRHANSACGQLPLPQDVSPGMRELVRWERCFYEHFARLVLENAAKVCDVEHKRDDLTGDYRYGAGICALNIRKKMP